MMQCPEERIKFEFMSKIGFQYYCFHDVDLVAPADNWKHYEKNIQAVVDDANLMKNERL